MKDYTLVRPHPFFALTRGIVGQEIRMGDTVTFLTEVDLTEIQRIRKHSTRQERPSYTAFVAKAVALSLRAFPYANRRTCKTWLPFFGQRLQQFHSCDVSVAVERNVPEVEVATFVDVLRDTDQLSLTEITAHLRALAACDESNNEQWRLYKNLVERLPAWLSTFIVRLPIRFPSMWRKYRGGAAIISSPTKYGVDMLVGAWTAPLGISFGLVKDRAVVREGRVVPCSTFTFTLNFDRRVMAGAQAARFFKHIVDLLEHPETEQAPARNVEKLEVKAEVSVREVASCP